MITELTIRDGDAALVLTASTDFEMETIDRLSKAFPKKEVQISLDWKDWNPDKVKSAKIVISFFPEPPQQFPSFTPEEVAREIPGIVKDNPGNPLVGGE